MPKFFFLKINGVNNWSFLFLNKYNFFTVLKNFMNIYKTLHKFFYFRLKLKGLGYSIRTLPRKTHWRNKRLYKFFFAYNHFFYFHLPIDILIRRKRMRILFISSDKQKLNNIFSQFLLLRKMDFYEKSRYFRVYNRILIMKRRK